MRVVFARYRDVTEGLLLGTVSSHNVDPTTVASTDDMDPPGMTTNFALLNEVTPDIRLDVDLDGLAAVRVTANSSGIAF
jgi:hypothetical protein